MEKLGLINGMDIKINNQKIISKILFADVLSNMRINNKISIICDSNFPNIVWLHLTNKIGVSFISNDQSPYPIVNCIYRKLELPPPEAEFAPGT